MQIDVTPPSWSSTKHFDLNLCIEDRLRAAIRKAIAAADTERLHRCSWLGSRLQVEVALPPSLEWTARVRGSLESMLATYQPCSAQ